MVYVFPLTSNFASLTTFDVPSTFVPAGDESTLPSLSTAVPSCERTPHVRAIESLCPISPIASTYPITPSPFLSILSMCFFIAIN